MTDLVPARFATAVASAALSGAGEDERAADLLEALRLVVPYDCAELSFYDPIARRHRTLHNAGYPSRLLAYFNGTTFAAECSAFGLQTRHAWPARQRDLDRPEEVPSIRDVFRPEGFIEGMTVCLVSGDDRYVGMINMSTTDARHPSDTAREAVGHLKPVMASVADVLRSVLHLVARLEPGTCAVALSRSGARVALPEVSDHPLLLDGSPLLPVVASWAAGAPGTIRFAWPDGAGWYAVTVTPARDRLLDDIAAVVALRPDPDLEGLTRRELEVLGLLARGLSNPAIGRVLGVSPRTVSTHVETILAKLGVSSRAAAAALAASEGLQCPVAAGRRPPSTDG